MGDTDREGVACRGFVLWCVASTVGSLAHVLAVTEVRLYIQSRSPQTEWVCERTLAREKQTPQEHLADAVVLLDGRQLAIEVELTVKSKRRTRLIIEELTGRYDGVLYYYCAPGPRRLISELATENTWSSLGIRELPARCEGVSL